MKLQCQVEVINTTHNVRRNSKYVKSTLALGKESRSENEFFILHFSTVNKSGSKYRVKNIKQVFVKFINDGKTTIRFDDPPHDLCIKSEALQLKCFMKLLKSCINGNGKALQLAPLATLSVTAKDNAPTKLVVYSRSDFPTKGFPRTLESLYMNGLRLCNFRRDILMLKHLTILDLSRNEIEKLPVEFGRMPSLTELYLQKNRLGGKENPDWRWLQEPQIAKTLKLLNLSSNQLSYLPKAIWKLQKLVTLHLNDNQLQRLPSTIGRINSLRYLTISKNHLECLPNSLLHCTLECIDVSENKFKDDPHNPAVPDPSPIYSNVESLVNLSAKIVLKQKILYAPNIIPRTLVQYLDDANMCKCGGPTFNFGLRSYTYYDLRDCFHKVDYCGGSVVKFECFFCSYSCYNNTGRYRGRSLRGVSL